MGSLLGCQGECGIRVCDVEVTIREFSFFVASNLA